MTIPIAQGKSFVPPSPPNPVQPKVPHNQVDPVLLKAAQGMESLFLDHMMQAMRKTIHTNPLSLENPATKIYRSMLDSEMAKNAAKQGGVGLADQIIEYLQATRYNVSRKYSAPKRRQLQGDPVRTGGTDEDR